MRMAIHDGSCLLMDDVGDFLLVTVCSAYCECQCQRKTILVVHHRWQTWTATSPQLDASPQHAQCPSTAADPDNIFINIV